MTSEPVVEGYRERLERYASAKLDIITKAQRADLRKCLRALLSERTAEALSPRHGEEG